MVQDFYVTYTHLAVYFKSEVSTSGPWIHTICQISSGMKVHNRYNVLESSPNHPLPQSVENCLPQNSSLVTKVVWEWFGAFQMAQQVKNLLATQETWVWSLSGGLVLLSDVPLLWPRGLLPATLLCPWGFLRQEYWGGLPFTSLGDLPSQPSNRTLSPPALQTDSLPTETPEKPKRDGNCCFKSSLDYS